MSFRVVPDIVTVDSICVLVYQYIAARTCVPQSHEAVIRSRNVRRILVREVNAPLPPEAKKILKN